ncbi:MAG: GNAT family N-acetyltransferase [Chloroflexi bacterium]|nr:GNAT family N-acetyltransferase [Chloroflexota bacterium]
MADLALRQEGELDRSGQEVTIRTMRAEEKPQVRRIAFRAFSFLVRLIFSWGDTVLVAERAGQLVGGIVLKVFPLARGRKAGFVAWLFSDPDARGLGVGQRLVEAAMAYFDAKGCDEVIAGIEGHNTSSSKLFATRGFGPLSPGEQWRRYGWQLPLIWWRTFHLTDVGHLFWVKPAATQEDNPAAQWWGSLLLNVLITWISIRVWSETDWKTWAVVPATIVVLLGVRRLGMWLAARAQGLEERYRAWESGFPLSLAIALVLRGLYIVPGGLYPKGNDWRYRDLTPQLGRMALAGVAGPLALLWLARGLAGVPAVSAVLPIINYVGFSLIILDVLVPFFPLACFNGRRLWDWSPVIWAVVAAIVVALVWII